MTDTPASESSTPAPQTLDASSTSAQIKARMRASYNAIAEVYLAWTSGSHPTRLKYARELVARVPPPATVLELGAGAGVPVTAFLAEQPGYSVTANDISGKQLAMARERLPEDRVTFVEGDMNELQFPDGSFDAVIAMFSIIHLPRDEQVELAGKIFHWLKPGGRFVANFAPQEMEAQVMTNWLKQEEGTMYWSSWGEEKTCSMLEKAGFAIQLREVLFENEGEKGKQVDVPFLWIMAQKPAE